MRKKLNSFSCKYVINKICLYIYIYIFDIYIKIRSNVWYASGGARGVMVIVIENGHGDTSSNPGRDWLHFP